MAFIATVIAAIKGPARHVIVVGCVPGMAIGFGLVLVMVPPGRFFPLSLPFSPTSSGIGDLLLFILRYLEWNSAWNSFYV